MPVKHISGGIRCCVAFMTSSSGKITMQTRRILDRVHAVYNRKVNTFQHTASDALLGPGKDVATDSGLLNSYRAQTTDSYLGSINPIKLQVWVESRSNPLQGGRYIWNQTQRALYAI